VCVDDDGTWVYAVFPDVDLKLNDFRSTSSGMHIEEEQPNEVRVT
jgi:hypothetical protein